MWKYSVLNQMNSMSSKLVRKEINVKFKNFLFLMTHLMWISKVSNSFLLNLYVSLVNFSEEIKKMFPTVEIFLFSLIVGLQAVFTINIIIRFKYLNVVV